VAAFLAMLVGIAGINEMMLCRHAARGLAGQACRDGLTQGFFHQ